MNMGRLLDIPVEFWGMMDDAAETRKARYEARARERGLEPCVSCGRGVTPGRGWTVCATGGGGDLLAVEDYNADPGAATRDPGYMGWWTIGPECGRWIPAEFRIRNEGV